MKAALLIMLIFLLDCRDCSTEDLGMTTLAVLALPVLLELKRLRLGDYSDGAFGSIGGLAVAQAAVGLSALVELNIVPNKMGADAKAKVLALLSSGWREWKDLAI